jgi:hypothetical protein
MCVFAFIFKARKHLSAQPTKNCGAAPDSAYRRHVCARPGINDPFNDPSAHATGTITGFRAY